MSVFQKASKHNRNGNIIYATAEHERSNNKTKTFSIIVSGWPAVGKTTVAAELADEFGLTIYSGGDILKQIATNLGYRTSGNDW